MLDNTRELIFNDLKEILFYTQDYLEDQNIDKSLNQILDTWYENKKDFIELFGGKLRYKFPEKVTFSFDSNIKIYDFFSEIGKLKNQELTNFITINADNLLTNKTKENFIYSDGVIPAGTKISKDLKYFIKDEAVLKKFQNLLSRLVQKEKMQTGWLYLSVDPRDYITISDNNAGWSTCHSMITGNNFEEPGGDRRAGNFSYMQDKSTVVCYVSGDFYESLTDYPDYIWFNSKHWRTLLYYSDDREVVIAGKEYPARSITKEGSLIDLIPVFPYTQWNNVPSENIEKYFEDQTSLHYNDITKYNTNYSYVASKDGKSYKFFSKNISDEPHFTIGHDVPCLICGNQITSLYTMLCDDHEEKYGYCFDKDSFVYCDTCGEVIAWDNAITINDGDGFCCPNCAKEEKIVCTCGNCGDLFETERLIYSKKYEVKICKPCYDSIEEE